MRTYRPVNPLMWALGAALLQLCLYAPNLCYGQSFAQDFDAAQTAYKRAVEGHDFSIPVRKMELVLQKYSQAREMYYVHSTLGKSYYGLAMTEFPDATNRTEQDYDTDAGRAYLKHLEKALSHIEKSISLIKSKSYQDYIYGLEVDHDEINLMQTIASRIRARFHDAGINRDGKPDTLETAKRMIKADQYNDGWILLEKARKKLPSDKNITKLREECAYHILEKITTRGKRPATIDIADLLKVLGPFTYKSNVRDPSGKGPTLLIPSVSHMMAYPVEYESSTPVPLEVK